MPDINTFLKTWRASGAAESANAQSFTNDLCALLGVPPPEPTRPLEADNAYVFEKSVPSARGVKKIDVYKRGCFILENKQGASGEDNTAAPISALHQRARQNARKGHGKRGTKAYLAAMQKAKRQAENYARGLAAEEITDGRPPFILVCDVGHQISVYADWTRAGGHYQPFPDPNNYRIKLDDLADEAIRERLRLIWTDPLQLDPARRSARVTKEVADRLAALAKSLETTAAEQDRQQLAGFLMRSLFTMFAEDVGLLDDRAFTRLLEDCTRAPESFVPMVTELWEKMNTGGYSVALRAKIRRFNGGLFADTTAVPLNQDQIQLLLEAAEADWREVEPAIFGTLLERALDPRERHKLGAHYTPRAYVERLVEPTILQPLRAEWDNVQAAAFKLADDGEEAKAIQEVERFLQRLADLRVLDPACGSANFLYVTLELLKRLEGEVRNALRDLGQGQISIGLTGATITPENMLGIELNPRAAKIAELVLWIGYLQWHLRSTGDLSDLGDPVLRDYHNIENRDAVLEYDHAEAVLDDDGQPVTRWDGVTYKTHPVTGEQVPDEAARTQVQRIVGAKQSKWPRADFIVGNPPFIGTSRMREALGDGYTEALRKTYKNVPNSADFVMFWWDKAAEAVRSGATDRFGLITTNSIRQTFNRRVIQHHMNQKKPLSLVFAIPDHPWVDSADGAAVRIAMTVGEAGNISGVVMISDSEKINDDKSFSVDFITEQGIISPELNTGVDMTKTIGLASNIGIAIKGFELGSQGFLVDKPLGDSWLESNPDYTDRLRPYMNGNDLKDGIWSRYVIDFHGLDQDSAQEYGTLYNHISSKVKADKVVNREKRTANKWWLFRRSGQKIRDAITNLPYFFGTTRTAKHRVFQALGNSIVAESKIVLIASSDFYHLGILSSEIHLIWTLGFKSFLGPTPNYNHTESFNNFPFPDPTEPQRIHIRALAERLDAHRKRQQAQHPKLTMTGMYNVLEKLRAEEPLNDKEKGIYEQGLVGILKEIHDQLDEAVALAYGWPKDLSEQDILQRLVDLNAARAAEEARGLVRWLRPEYQAPEEYARGTQATLELETEGVVAAPVAVAARKWPAALPEQVAAVREVLAAAEGALTLPVLAQAFKPKLSKKRQEAVEGILAVLESLGSVERTELGWVLG